MKRTFTGQLMLITSLIFLTLMVLSVATQALYYQSIRSIMEDDLKYAARAAADMTELYSSGAYSSERMLRFQLIEGVSLPCAYGLLPKTGFRDDCQAGMGLADDLCGFHGPFEGACIDGVKMDAGKGVPGETCLLPAFVVEGDIRAALKPAVDVPGGLSVSYHIYFSIH